MEEVRQTTTTVGEWPAGRTTLTIEQWCKDIFDSYALPSDQNSTDTLARILMMVGHMEVERLRALVKANRLLEERLRKTTKQGEVNH